VQKKAESGPVKRFLYLKDVYIFMPDIKHKICTHTDRTVKMQRLYKREEIQNPTTGEKKKKFVGCAWMCPDCWQMVRD